MISQPVGRVSTTLRSANARNDVLTVQKLINRQISKISPLARLKEDGKVGPKTIDAIIAYQRRVVGLRNPDGRVDPGGLTLRSLAQSAEGVVAAERAATMTSGVFSHPDAAKVRLKYSREAVRLNPKAEMLLKSILASCEIWSAELTSTLRTYHDQARITLTQTLQKRGESTVRQWYGQRVLEACKQHKDDIVGLAQWWKEYDRKRGRVSSKHLSNLALDVVPGTKRAKFVAKVQELIPLRGTGVKKIIPKGVMNEPVDHVEFTFSVT